MTIQVITRGVVQQLFNSISDNLHRYRGGDFSVVIQKEYIRPIEGTESIAQSFFSLNDRKGGDSDAENSYIVFSALKGLNPNLARDERIWVYLTHFHCLDFTRKRWLDPGWSDEKLIAGIRAHFFARGSRGFERNNSIASLWWWAFLASRHETKSLRDTLEIFLKYTDVRSSIVERPSILSISPRVFSALINVLKMKMDEDATHSFLRRREGGGAYRLWLKSINLSGGTRFYEHMPLSTLTDHFFELSCEAEKRILSQ